MERNYHYQPNKRIFSGSGNNIIQTPIRNNQPNRLEEENKRLRAELNRKDKMIEDYQKRISNLNQKIQQLTSQLNRQRNNHTNSTNQRRFDAFSDPFFSNPSSIFNDMFFQNNIPNQGYNDIYQPQETNLEDEIINQLYPNPDNMTYEELLALEEQVGNVSKGLSKKEISSIPVVPYSKYTNKDCDKCAVCQYEYKEKEKVKKLRCGHLFHIDCINTWLEDNKVCPICKKEAIFR